MTWSAAVFLIAAPAVFAAAPKAVAVEPVKDVGTVAKGDKVLHEFVIKNDGDAPLEITEVQAACGCTATSYDRTIAPGKTGVVRAELDTISFNGGIAKAVTAYTNDPVTPRIELTIKAKVEPLLAARPGYARFIKQGPDGIGHVEQIVWSPKGEAFEVTKVESPYPFLKVTYHPATAEERREVNAASGGYVFDFALDYAAAPVGAIADHVLIHTTHARQKVVPIPVSGFVRPAVAVTPAVIDFGDLQVTGPVRATVHVQGFLEGTDFTVTRVEGDVTGMEANVEPVANAVGREFNVRLLLDPKMPKGAFNGTLKLFTNHPKKPVVEVPIKGRIL
ncbi:MAG TPA: DUF1573 domain-containing protein [Thermoanaerobaculia bacterium]|nr:DUF1573 domain-containing protein [Thermoanaerobaculia bacterium]